MKFVLNKQKIVKINHYLRISYFAILFSYAIFGIIFMDTPYSINNVYGYGPNDPECFEIGDCDLFDAPFDAMIEPFDAVFEGFTLVIIWGIIIGILWLRVSNPMMVAVVGVGLAALFTRPDAACIAQGNPESACLTGFSIEAQAVGWGLLILALVVAIYQILTVRVHFPTN